MPYYILRIFISSWKWMCFFSTSLKNSHYKIRVCPILQDWNFVKIWQKCLERNFQRLEIFKQTTFIDFSVEKKNNNSIIVTLFQLYSVGIYCIIWIWTGKWWIRSPTLWELKICGVVTRDRDGNNFSMSRRWYVLTTICVKSNASTSGLYYD